MKTTIHLCSSILLLGIPILCRGQVATVPVPTPYAIVHREANERTWQRTTYEASPAGKAIPHVESYKECATGLCYFQDGQWQDSQELISILPDGSAEAVHGQHQAYFPGDIANGPIRLENGSLSLRSEPLGLSYDDGTNTVLIGELTNSVGELINANQVLYPHAFAGVDADLLYTYRKSGFEQDVIFREQPPVPEAYGMDEQSARLQMLTEFFNPPAPVISTRSLPAQAGVSLADQTLDFGQMNMIPGRMFLLGTNADGGPVRVGKRWVNLDGRQILVEEVPVAAIVDDLSKLPVGVASSANVTKAGYPLNIVSARRLLPERRLTKKAAPGRIEVAENKAAMRGLLLDYQIVNGSTQSYTFQGDTTYYISGAFELFGTNTFEGGTVIKYTNGASIDLVPNQNMPVINWLGAPYRPVIFTAKDDNSVGDTISGSTGNPSGYYANPALFWFNFASTAQTLTGFRIAYAQQAMELEGGNYTFGDGQILNCENGINAIDGTTAELADVLFGNVAYDLNSLYGVTFSVENSTFSSSSNVTTIEESPFQTVSCSFTNCILANVLSLTNSYNGPYVTYNVAGDYNGFYNAPVFGSDTTESSTYPFQTVGAGSYYLTNGCVFRGAGTTNIDPALLVALAGKTTWPPVVYDRVNISSLGTLGPIAQRNTGLLDLGYSYDALDYVFGGCDLFSNLTVTTGTGVGWFMDSGSVSSSGQPYGISLNGGANLSFNGNATQPCFFARYSMVQEAENGDWADMGYMAAFMFNGGSPAPWLSGNFTKMTVDEAHGSIFRDNWTTGSAGFRNCEFYNGGMGTYDMQSVSFTNCLLFRDAFAYWDQDYAVSFAYENCTFYNGCLAYDRSDGYPSEWTDAGLSSSFWLIENCSFDGTAFAWFDCLNANPANTLINYNSYNTNNLSWQTYPFPYPPTFGTNEVVGANDLMVTNYDWQTSWFGNFYLPPNSPLIDAGSTDANYLGLYHFTTQTNQNIEGDSTVDIGYHYVATDQYGNPLDSNGDGIPDYIEDANGNGVVDSGEIGWNIYNDPGLSVFISQPKNGSTLP